MMKGSIFLTLFGLIMATQVEAGEPAEITFKGANFTLYRLDPATETLRLFWQDANGQPFNTFKKLEADLAKKGKQLTFATNGGIYLGGWTPEGLHIENGKTLRALNLTPAPDVSPVPNFSLKPNGVFLIRTNGSPVVMESNEYASSGESPRLAVQSGPLLLHNGAIHPAFNEPSTSRLLRNGVGVDSAGRIVFACSHRDAEGKGRINLYGFAQLFRDKLDCRSALYLDGDISEIYIQGHTGEMQNTTAFAAILGVVEAAEN